MCELFKFTYVNCMFQVNNFNSFINYILLIYNNM